MFDIFDLIRSRLFRLESLSYSKLAFASCKLNKCAKISQYFILTLFFVIKFITFFHYINLRSMPADNSIWLLSRYLLPTHNALVDVSKSVRDCYSRAVLEQITSIKLHTQNCDFIYQLLCHKDSDNKKIAYTINITFSWLD